MHRSIHPPKCVTISSLNEYSVYVFCASLLNAKLLICIWSEDVALSSFFLLEAELIMSSWTVHLVTLEFTFVFCKFVCVFYVLSVVPL